MTEKLYRLAYAISLYEGWDPLAPTGSGNSFGSASYRNHNPGNLRSSPFQLTTRNGFAVFYNDQIGFQALMYDLWIKCSGRSTTGLKKTDTLAKLVSVYAPPSENNTQNYIDFLVLKTGFKATMLLSEFLP